MCFRFVEDEGRARHPLVISRKTYERSKSALLEKPLRTNCELSRLFKDFTKGKQEHQLRLRFLGHIRTEQSYARHKQLCKRNDFMSVLHVLPVPDSKQAQIKF